METVRDYRDLKIWQQAVDLAPDIYEIARRLPAEERFALGDQLRRAVVSVPANIAEGQARRHTAEYLHFLSIARGSLAELDTLLTIARKIGYINITQLDTFQERLAHVRRGIHGLSVRLKARTGSG